MKSLAKSLVAKKIGLLLATAILINTPININATNTYSKITSSNNTQYKKLSRANYLAIATTIINALSNIFGRISAQTPTITTTTPTQQTSPAQVVPTVVVPTQATPTPTTTFQTTITPEPVSPTGIPAVTVSLTPTVQVAPVTPINHTLATVGTVLSNVSAVLTTVNTIYQATHPSQSTGSVQGSHHGHREVQVLKRNF
jgi:hypothetical protein